MPAWSVKSFTPASTTPRVRPGPVVCVRREALYRYCESHGIEQRRCGARQPAGDFVLQGPTDHGVAGLMNLFGIESPGLTASLAIADEVLNRLAL